MQTSSPQGAVAAVAVSERHRSRPIRATRPMHSKPDAAPADQPQAAAAVATPQNHMPWVIGAGV